MKLANMRTTMQQPMPHNRKFGASALSANTVDIIYKRGTVHKGFRL